MPKIYEQPGGGQINSLALFQAREIERADLRLAEVLKDEKRPGRLRRRLEELRRRYRNTATREQWFLADF